MQWSFWRWLGFPLFTLASPVWGDAALTAAARPTAEIRAVTDTYFGQEVRDPYRYLEDATQPDVVAYMKGQAAHTRKTLDALPGRSAMLARINTLSQAGVQVSGVQLAGATGAGLVFYYKLSPGESTRRLFVRQGVSGAERLVFDPATVSTAANRVTIDSFTASPDGHHVAVGIAAGGSEDTSLIVINVAKAKAVGRPIDRIAFAEMTRWSPDSKSFFYNRLPPVKSGEPPNRYLHSVAYRHVIGRAVEQDERVLGGQVDAKTTLADIDIPSVTWSSDSKSLIGKILHGDLREISLFVASVGDFRQPLSWKKVIDPSHEVTNFVTHGANLYLLTHHEAPRYKIVRLALPQPDWAQRVTVMPHGDTVIREMAIAQDALYVRELFGGVDRMQRLNVSESIYSGGQLEFLRLPFDLAVRQLVTHPSRPGAIVRLEGWTESPRYMRIEERTGTLSDTRLQPKSPIDFSGIDEVRLTVTAKDGTKIPLSLMYKKGTLLDTLRPAILRAYGAYGITMTPAFNPATLAWLERGGIIGTCHVRGGGEFGEEWHRGGQKLTKPNSWRDLIACSEYLIDRQFTRTARLAIQGGSAGGITVGRALTERPDLFAAVIPSVGVLDAIRAEFTPNGPPNIPEFGSVKTEDGFKGLFAMSAYHQVRDGTPYPSVMLTHGVNDPRVEVWQSTKMAARLQAATSTLPNANPVLLRLDYDAGHGIGSSRSQRNAELADVYSFLLWRFGDPAFQPGAQAH